MKKIVTYLILMGLLYIYIIYHINAPNFSHWILSYKLIIECSILGGLGGIFYCLRGVYLNVCVYKSWDKEWHVWYVIRPFTSMISGGVSYIFLKAGLFVLEAAEKTDASDYGYLALAFIAGLNVDKFIKKVQDVSQSTFGVGKRG